MDNHGARLVDFGLVRLADGGPASAVGGTPGYLAPEVLETGTYSPASDRFAFGGVMYFLVTGRHPPVGEHVSRLRESLLATRFGEEHPGLVDPLLRAMAADPRDRPPAITQWLSAFGAATDPPAALSDLVPRRRSGTPFRAALALAVLSMLAVFAVDVSRDGETPAVPPSARADIPGSAARAAAGDVVLELENGAGDGDVMRRSEASNTRTLWLHDGQSVRIPFAVDATATYGLMLRYSNDNDDALPSEDVAIHVDGVSQGVIVAADTGSGGAGWNVFQVNAVADVQLAAGSHELVIDVRGGDGYGVEVDRVQVVRRSGRVVPGGSDSAARGRPRSASRLR